MNPRRRRHNKRARRWRTRDLEWVPSPLGPIWNEIREEMVRLDQRLWADLLAAKFFPPGVMLTF